MIRTTTRSRPDLEQLARRVRRQLQRKDSHDFYEGFEYANFWGEFCHWVQYVNRGPIPDTVWEETVMAFVWGVVDNVSTKHLPALTEMAEMELGWFHRAPEDGSPYIDQEMIVLATFQCLTELASLQSIGRFVPPGLRDQYF